MSSCSQSVIEALPAKWVKYAHVCICLFVCRGLFSKMGVVLHVGAPVPACGQLRSIRCTGFDGIIRLEAASNDQINKRQHVLLWQCAGMGVPMRGHTRLFVCAWM